MKYLINRYKQKDKIDKILWSHLNQVKEIYIKMAVKVLEGDILHHYIININLYKIIMVLLHKK